MDGMLSQDEINALLNGMDPGGASTQTDTTSASTTDTNTTATTSASTQDFGDEHLTDIEKDAIGEVANISMGTSATTLYSLVNRKVNITTPVVTLANWESVIADYEKPCVFIQIKYSIGLQGTNILVLKEHDVKVITDLMMGGDGTNIEGEIGELHLSAISEAMNQMMGSSATSLSSMLGLRIDITPPEASLIDLSAFGSAGEIAPFLEHTFVKISFRMQIDDLVDSTIMQLYPIDFARSLYSQFITNQKADEPEPQPQPQSASDQPDLNNASYGGMPVQGLPNGAYDQMGMGMPMQNQMNMGMQPNGMNQMNMAMNPYGMNMGMPPNGMNPMGMQPNGMNPMGMQPNGMNPMGMQPNGMNMGMQPQANQNVNVQQAQFQNFNSDFGTMVSQENIELIKDVPLEVTVELGRTTKSISDILDFAPGTIIELDKLAGEPVDVMVNGKFVARGEVVTIEESFCVRITEIIK